MLKKIDKIAKPLAIIVVIALVITIICVVAVGRKQPTEVPDIDTQTSTESSTNSDVIVPDITDDESSSSKDELDLNVDVPNEQTPPTIVDEEFEYGTNTEEGTANE